jgi:hypothetical protein
VALAARPAVCMRTKPWPASRSRPVPDEGNAFVNRLWSRSGLRVLSIMVLLLGLVGGGFLSNDRHHQQIATATNRQAQLDLAYQQQVAQQQAAAYQAAAPIRSQLAAAQAAANKQATVAAAAAAAKAQQAVTNARKENANTSSRSSTRTSSTPPPPVTGPIPKSCSAYTGNRAIGCSLVLAAGLSLTQMACLDKMWTRESNWRTTADNPSSHSYGIPQALPASKMAAFGSDYRSNPATQIKWGLSYIKGRYGTPCDAWTFWQAHDWY